MRDKLEDQTDDPRQINSMWSMDFKHECLADGSTFRTFAVLDDYNREVLGIEVDKSLPVLRVIRALDQIIEWRKTNLGRFVVTMVLSTYQVS